ncbi:dihydrodipicolinate reductase [Alkalithermobacter thermoalcaliphilus JW-YL-7 = DSM 7308]|uniref:4-hydroxy-tetrahydrodipicolinate reductase n=1 Tax=Alkalithermobacter thermoalcaliphilus JW-YL-7 = DSM 7308 TaxID=1121328 RepID=A0A150FRN8_CLOPD|nr:Dihydrodipicolinate reductase [[Clostridium] paradoxum JW-YL-7 = DSM 7308]SHK40077.1 dihydrodipicolinate reductase [[Clostridium] paradoxum JW-YL-7 = DSM 7308]
MINVALNGCLGKMGMVLIDSISRDPDLNLVAGVDTKTDNSLGFPVYTSALDIKEKVDVIIDFSRPESLDDLLSYAKSNKTALVIATTGYSDDQINKIVSHSKEIPIFHSSNMSVGVNLVLDLVKTTTKALYGFDIEIVEKHHNKKVDAPSGTALMIAKEIKETLDNQVDFNYGRFGKDAKRNKSEIGIHAVRGGTIVGEHSTIFAGPDEIVEINHIALSKEIFAEGAKKAAKFIVSKENGYYNMKDIIKL